MCLVVFVSQIFVSVLLEWSKNYCMRKYTECSTGPISASGATAIVPTLCNCSQTVNKEPEPIVSAFLLLVIKVKYTPLMLTQLYSVFKLNCLRKRVCLLVFRI